jgi:Mg2+ and Co2+ transporter CorA
MTGLLRSIHSSSRVIRSRLYPFTVVSVGYDGVVFPPSNASHCCHHSYRRWLSTGGSTTANGTHGSGNGNGTHHSPRMSLQGQSPTFKVSKVTYRDGTCEIVNLHTSELLQTIYARDLFTTLNVTSRQERRRGGDRPLRRPLAAILPRGEVMVLSFGTVRAVAGLEYAYVLDAHMPYVQDFAREVAQLYKSGNLEGESYELVFLEEVLRNTIDSFYRRLRIFDPIVDSFLDRVTNEVYSDTGVHQLVPLKDSLQAFEIQVRQCLDCLTAILNDDEQMLNLLLSEHAQAKKAGKQVEFSRHEHVELLIGVYARQLGNILMEVQYLLGRLQSKQEFVALALSGYRNRMIRMNVHIGIFGMSMGFMTTIAGVYGMNLPTGLEASPMAFYNVVMMSGMGSMVIALGALNYLSGNSMRKRAAQRVEEIETLTGALHDMCALDYTVKSTVEKGIETDRDTFQKIMRRARYSKRISTKESDLLFDSK